MGVLKSFETNGSENQSQSKYNEIHVCCVLDDFAADMNEFVNHMATGPAGGGNVYKIPRADIQNLAKGGKAVQMDKAMTGLKKSLTSVNLTF